MSDQSRKDFEAYSSQQGYPLQVDDCGDYIDEGTRRSWNDWKAARVLNPKDMVAMVVSQRWTVDEHTRAQRCSAEITPVHPERCLVGSMLYIGWNYKDRENP